MASQLAMPSVACRPQVAAAPSRARHAPVNCVARRAAVVARAGLDESKLGLTSVNLERGGKSAPAGTSSAPKKAEKPKEVELKSELGIDYSALKKALDEGRFQDADDETRSLLIRQAGAEAVARGWVYFTEVRNIPAADLQTVDNLWRAASNNKFGYTAQREVWIQNRRQWPRFFKAIDWVFVENNHYRKWPGEFIYSTDAKKGHLPLTNALRGTQLFQEIMEHPAFNKPKASLGSSSSSSSSGSSSAPKAGGEKPAWLK
ncbi:unnamed protein product [Pedinophyceae sp. YPF-701]|nr:unnamed protein product [Pedinophyceae sp. YPF-701]